MILIIYNELYADIDIAMTLFPYCLARMGYP